MRTFLFQVKIFAVILIYIFISLQTIAQSDISKGLNQITPQLIQKYVDYLASDSLKGRATPSQGQDLAADYIVGHFKKIAINPVNGTYFQSIHLSKIRLGNENYLSISKDGVKKDFMIKDDFVPYEFTASQAVKSAIVFAGYGITAPEYNYDDYKEIDVKGKIVLVLKHEPGEENEKSVFKGTRLTKYSNIKEKLKIAIDHGAIGMLVVTDPLNHSSLIPRGFPWPSLSKMVPLDNLPEIMFNENEKRIPVVQIGEEVINQLFGNVESLKNIQKKIDHNVLPQSFLIDKISCSLQTSTEIIELSAKNVVGYIEGADPELKKELLIIGAHYDHVGFIKNHKEGEDFIYNGADDNASGTAGVMAIAGAFQELKQKPKRSVLFILFTAEEMGLLGSKYYTDYPLFPLNKTAAMLNLDMISRAGKDSVELTGWNQNPDLQKITEEENVGIGLKLINPGDELFGRSDHARFFEKNIPIMFYIAGLHNEYHTVKDNPDRIDADKAAKITKLVFKTAWRIANDNKQYKINKPNSN